MDNKVLEVSPRGQITIPKHIREKLGFKRVIAYIEDDKVVLEPVKTKKEFLQELDDIYDDYKRNGGTSLKDIKKELGIR